MSRQRNAASAVKTNGKVKPIRPFMLEVLEDRMNPVVGVFDDIAGRALDNSGLWYVAVSDGTKFTTTPFGQWTPNIEWKDVRKGDFNNDGREDMVGRGNGELWVALATNVPQNSFVMQRWGAWSNTVVWTEVLSMDVNGDGRSDLMGRTLGQWWYAESQNNNTFLTRSWGFWANNIVWVDVKAADVTGDGRDDIVGRTSGQWWVARMNGTNTGFINQYWGFWSTGVDWVDVRIGDYNNDGRDDIAGREVTGGQWWIAKSTFVGGNPDGVLVNQLWAFWNPSADWTDVLEGDYNFDNRSDLAGRVNSSGEWYVLLSTGTNFTSSKWTTWARPPGVTWVDVGRGDFNGDGFDDIAGRINQNGQWWVGLSDGQKFNNQYWGAWTTQFGWQFVTVGNFAAPPGGTLSRMGPGESSGDDGQSSTPSSGAGASGGSAMRLFGGGNLSLASLSGAGGNGSAFNSTAQFASVGSANFDTLSLANSVSAVYLSPSVVVDTDSAFGDTANRRHFAAAVDAYFSKQDSRSDIFESLLVARA